MANENMNTMELDFTGVESSNYIPEGIHLVKIKDASYGKAGTGSAQLEVTFENGDGEIRKSWYNLLPQCLWKLKGFLETLGVPCDGKIKLNTKVLIGKACKITVEPDLNDPEKLTITRVTAVNSGNKVEAPYGAPIGQGMVPQAPVSAMPSTPAYTQPAQPIAPVQPAPQVEMPAQQPQQAPAGNLPPWMSQAPAGTTPNGNLPPWMQGQNK